jgi:hypothetical protein
MVIIYFFFGYQKWFDYEAQGLIPFFTHGPLIFWMYPSSGSRAPRTSWAFPSGCSERCCSPASGTGSIELHVRAARQAGANDVMLTEAAIVAAAMRAGAAVTHASHLFKE